MESKGAQITTGITALGLIIALLGWLIPFEPFARSPLDRTGETAVSPIPGSSTTEPESETNPPSTLKDLPDAGERSSPEPPTGILDDQDSSDRVETSSEDGRKKETVPRKQPKTEEDAPGKTIWVSWAPKEDTLQPGGSSAPWSSEEGASPNEIGEVASVARPGQPDLETDSRVTESNHSPPGSVDQSAFSGAGDDWIPLRPGILHGESIVVIAPAETGRVRPDRILRLPKLPPAALPALDGKEVVIHAVIDRQGRCSIGRIEPTEVNQAIVQRIVSDLSTTRWTVENTGLDEYPIKIIYR